MEVVLGVLVDSFTVKVPKSIYFLTHWHADHYAGISNKWPYGPIYCSPITRRLLLTKYPLLSDTVIELSLGQFHEIPYTQQGEQTSLRVKLFDSNHMAGSVMILFRLSKQKRMMEQGHSQPKFMTPNLKSETQDNYFLHTGDMRFNAKILKKETELFQISKQNQYRCRYPISKLFLDNTYCDPIFQFPNRSDAIRLAKNVIDKELSVANRSLHVCLVTDSVGKQQAFLALAIHYSTKISLSEERYRYCEAIFGEQKAIMEKFFIKKEEEENSPECWIEVVKRNEKDRYKGKINKRTIFISLTGWANIQDFHKSSGYEYIIPYSLHSNYSELELFMSAVKPKQLIPIVNHNNSSKSENFRNVIHSYSSYFGSLMHMKQRGLPFLRKEYTQGEQR